MLEITIDTHGLLDAFAKIPGEVTKSLRQEMKNQLFEVKREARKVHRHSQRFYAIQFAGDKKRKVRRSYKLTGKLNQSITVAIDPSGLIGQVGLDPDVAYYGKYVHEGHGSWVWDSDGRGYFIENTWPPDKFLDAALLKQEPKLQVGLEAALRSGLQAAGAL